MRLDRIACRAPASLCLLEAKRFLNYLAGSLPSASARERRLNGGRPDGVGKEGVPAPAEPLVRA